MSPAAARDDLTYPSFCPSTSETPNHLRAISSPAGYDYLLSQPTNPTTDAPPRWPLILFLHGVSERGSQVLDVARQGLPRMVSGTGEMSHAEAEVGRDIAARFMIVAPQCPPYEVWNEGEVIRLLDDVSKHFPVDPTRVYLTGLSMGGFGTWSIGLRQPQRFAALVPVCGGGRIADLTAAVKNHPAALRRLGVWAFHGARDRVVPLEESERMIDVLRRSGVADVKFTIYAEGEHDAWTATYANPELYRWLLHHAR